MADAEKVTKEEIESAIATLRKLMEPRVSRPFVGAVNEFQEFVAEGLGVPVSQLRQPWKSAKPSPESAQNGEAPLESDDAVRVSRKLFEELERAAAERKELREELARTKAALASIKADDSGLRAALEKCEARLDGARVHSVGASGGIQWADIILPGGLLVRVRGGAK